MTAERYTAVFMGVLAGKEPGEYTYLTMSEDPLGPKGSHALRRGKPPRKRLGREIQFKNFPEGCRTLILQTYRGLWDL